MNFKYFESILMDYVLHFFNQCHPINNSPLNSFPILSNRKRETIQTFAVLKSLVQFFTRLLIDKRGVLIFMLDSFYKPCPFTGLKMFWAGPNFLCQTKNLFSYCDCHKHFVPDKKMISIQYTVFPRIVSALEQFPPLNSFRTYIYYD